MQRGSPSTSLRMNNVPPSHKASGGQAFIRLHKTTVSAEERFLFCYTNLMQIILLDAAEAFLHSLTEKEIAKALRTVELLEEFGNNLGMPHSRHMASGLLELRIRGMREIRIFYCFHKGKAVLLHAYIKKTRHTPEKELQKARAAKGRLQ